MSFDDLRFISKLPEATWTDVSTIENGIPESRILELATRGLVVLKDPEPGLAELSARDELVRQVDWNRYAQQSHFLTKWSDKVLEEAEKKRLDWERPSSFTEFEARYGDAPPAVQTPSECLTTVDLPLVKRREKLFRLLKRRRTTRTFDREKNLSIEDLSVVLRYSFGIHGYLKMSNSLTILKKTSPSGGALHPIDIYALVSRVDGLETGVYHYNPAEHALSLLDRVAIADAQPAALQSVANQAGFSHAHVMFFLVARYGRHFWKYRKHQKGYKVVTMDAAHLSQTLYLVCTELGLGAYVTAAINDKYIEELLGVDDVNDGIVAVCGAGIPGADDPEEFRYEPFVPRKTKLNN